MSPHPKIGPAMQAFVTIAVMVAFLGVIAALLRGLFGPTLDLPPGVREVLLILIGHLAGSFKDTVGFWIKSSYGSQEKTAIIAKSPPVVEP